MSAEAAQAFWLELQRGLQYLTVLRQPPAGRRRRTGEMRVTITERRAMQAFHLLYGESYTALARRFRRDRHYMPRWIWEPQYRAFHSQYWSTNEGDRPCLARDPELPAQRCHLLALEQAGHNRRRSSIT